MAINTAYASSEEQVIRESTKGLPFMALQFNVLYKRRQLAINKEVTPAEYYLLEEIEIGTIGARNSRNQICSEAEFDLKELASLLGIRVNKIYVQLKSLHKKGFITRKPTRYKGLELIGLDPKVFGQVLIDSQHSIEKKRHLKLVDKSPEDGDNSESDLPKKDGESPDLGSVISQKRSDSRTIRDQTSLQSTEIIEENPPLDSFRFNIDSFRGQKGEIKSPQQTGPGTGNSWTQEYDPNANRLKLLEQVRMMKEGRL